VLVSSDKENQLEEHGETTQHLLSIQLQLVNLAITNKPFIITLLSRSMEKKMPTYRNDCLHFHWKPWCF